MAEMAVETRELTRKFGDFVAVDRISFEVEAGEIFGFLGSNGAGKSTTIRMLCGLLRPTSGDARVAGFDVYRDAEKIKNSIGYMSQKFSLYEELTVEENVDFFGGIYGLRSGRLRDRKKEILKVMGLEQRRDTLTSVLPGGWKQRLALGCALLHEPSILFLDEPTSGVDPVARRAFWDLIYDQSELGRTVFVTTHYMDEAEYCNRLALMDAGQLIALDTPNQLRKGLAGENFLQLQPEDLLASLRALEGDELLLDVAIFGGGLRIRTKQVEAAKERVRKRLEESKLAYTGLNEVEPGVEDVFVTRVEERRR